MKKFILGISFFAASIIASLSSCKKTDVAATPDVATTTTAINADPSLTIFSALISKAGDASTVNGSAALVIPVDSAFTSAGFNASSIASLSATAADSIVRYYSFASPVNFGGNVNTQSALVSSLGPSMYADSTTTGLYFNGVPSLSITASTATNAPFYKLSQYIIPAVATVSQITANDPSLSLFNEAMTWGNLASDFATGSYTLFMPSNSAFAAAGYPDIASIDAADMNALTQLLTYNIIPVEYFKNDLATKTSIATLEGASLQVSDTNGSLQFLGNGANLAPATLLNNGELAGNVLTYKVNSLLTPQ